MKQKTEVKYIDTSRNIGNEVYEKELKESVSDFFDFYVRYIDEIFQVVCERKRTKNKRDSIVELFRTTRFIFLQQKGNFYILIRERTGVQTQYTTKVIGKMKNIYKELYLDHVQKGYLEINPRIENSMTKTMKYLKVNLFRYNV